jgi:hypothetical protein
VAESAQRKTHAAAGLGHVQRRSASRHALSVQPGHDAR